MKITEEQIKEVSKRVGAKYREISKKAVEDGRLLSEKYLKELREQEMQEMDTEIAKLKNQ